MINNHYVASLKIEKVSFTDLASPQNQPKTYASKIELKTLSRDVEEVVHLIIKDELLEKLIVKAKAHLDLVTE